MRLVYPLAFGLGGDFASASLETPEGKIDHVTAAAQPMGSNSTQIGNGDYEVSRVSDVDGSTQPRAPRAPSVEWLRLQRFTGKPSPLVCRARRCDISGALAQKALQPTPWIAVAFLSPLVRRGCFVARLSCISLHTV